MDENDENIMSGIYSEAEIEELDISLKIFTELTTDKSFIEKLVKKMCALADDEAESTETFIETELADKKIDLKIIRRLLSRPLDCLGEVY